MTPRPIVLLLSLAFALVAVATFAAPAGEEAAAAEKEMVLDPTTGEMISAPEYGGTFTFHSRRSRPALTASGRLRSSVTCWSW